MAHERRSDREGQARQWPRGVLCALLALLVASPTVAAAEAADEPAVEALERAVARGTRRFVLFGALTHDAPPPWAVEAPGAAEACFGLGLETFFEHQESLRITAREGTIRVRDLASGREESGFLPDDADLLNRKLDLLWEATGPGVALAVALPDLELGAGRLYPSLVFEAAAADVSLDFHDRTVAADSTSLSGTGALFGAGFDLTAALCRDCPWFGAAGYRFRKLPRFAVDRSPRFGPQGLQVLEDEVRLEREAQEVSTRTGYVFAGGRFASWVGVLHRWTDLEVEDELRYRDRATETHLSSRTRLESEATLGLAGLDASLGPRLRGRLETAVGEEDYGARLAFVYAWSRAEAAPGNGRSSEVEEEERLARQRAVEIAAALGPPLAAIEAAFLAGWKSLTVIDGPDGRPAYLAREVEDLLARTERALLAELGRFPELEALGDWVADELRVVRAESGLTATTKARTADPRGEAVTALAGWPSPTLATGSVRLAQSGSRAVDKRRTDGAFDDGVQKGRQLAKARRLRVRLVFTTPLAAQLTIYPRYNRSSDHAATLSRDSPKEVWMGGYSFEVNRTRIGERLHHCDAAARPPGPSGPCAFELLFDPCVVLSCDDEECKERECP